MNTNILVVGIAAVLLPSLTLAAIPLGDYNCKSKNAAENNPKGVLLTLTGNADNKDSDKPVIQLKWDFGKGQTLIGTGVVVGNNISAIYSYTSVASPKTDQIGTENMLYDGKSKIRGWWAPLNGSKVIGYEVCTKISK